MKNLIIFRFIGILKKRLTLYALAILGITVTLTMRQVYLAWILKDLFNYAAYGDFRKLIMTVVVGLVVVGILGVLRPIFKYIAEKAVNRAIGDLKKEIYSKILRLPIDYFSREHSGNIISKLTNDIKDVEIALTTRLVLFSSFIVCAIFATVAMFYLDTLLAVIALVTAGVALMGNALFATPLRKVSRKIQERLGVLTERLTDLLAGVKVTRAFNLYEVVVGKFAEHNEEVYYASLKRVELNATLASINDFGKMIDIIGVMGIGAFLAVNGKVSVGAIIAVWQLKTPILTVFKEIGNIITGLQTGLAGAERLFNILDEPEEPKSYHHLEVDSAGEKFKAVVLKDVDFGYRSDELILHQLSLEVEKGQKVAIVGPSGEGKSTIFNLLLGFYPPERGKILIDGESLGRSDLIEIRKKIAYVPQNVYLFSGSIMENIRYGRLDATDDEVMEAARLAYAHEFIAAFEDGYDTYVGERGAQISGGQRQRVGIARALLKDAPIILLDEATSALDAESEHQIKEAVDGLSKGRTIVVITHRFSTIVDADQIFVVTSGQIQEKGSHGELMRIPDGVYRRLYEQQYDTLFEVV